VAIGVIVGVMLAAAWAFTRAHFVVPVSVPVFAVLLTYNAVAIYEYSRVRLTFSKFIGPEMVKRTLHLFTHLRLGGTVEEASAMFCDLRGYSTLSEQLPPETTAELVNDYTHMIVSIIRQHQGRTVDFLGDGVFVIFERAIAGRRYPVKAVKAAQEILVQFAEFRARWAARGIQPLEMGLAIHTGEMMIGIVGSEHQYKMGAIGDVVNVAARVQGLSKTCGYDLLITQETYERLDEEVPAVCCGSFPVKGRTQPVTVYGISASQPHHDRTV